MTPPARPTRRQVIHGYLVLPHAVPIIVVLAATAAFALVAARGWPGWGDLLCLVGAMFGGQLAVGAVNELVDAELDAVAKPEKPIPAGLVSWRGAWVVTIGGLLLMAMLSLRFDLEAFVLLAIANGSGIAYSLWFKRTIWAWVPYLVSLPLIPIWVWAALDEIISGLFAIYPIGAAAVIAVQIAQSLPDIEGDRRTGVRTLAVAIGPEHAHHIAWGAMLLASALAAVLAPWLTDHPERVWIGAALAVLLVGINAVIWQRNPRSGALAAFPCLAPAATLLGLGWAAGLV